MLVSNIPKSPIFSFALVVQRRIFSCLLLLYPEGVAEQLMTLSLEVMNRPPFLSPFRQSHGVISRVEGPNDGLVSVASSQWGSYKGTLVDVSHLDLINWTNRWRWMLRSLAGIKPGYVKCYAFLSTIAHRYVASMLSLSISVLPICSPKRAFSK